MDKLKKSGMDMDMDIQQMDWVEDNKKVTGGKYYFYISEIRKYFHPYVQVKAFFIYESSVWRLTLYGCDKSLSSPIVKFYV